jgi:hypothetical protein
MEGITLAQKPISWHHVLGIPPISILELNLKIYMYTLSDPVCVPSQATT